MSTVFSKEFKERRKSLGLSQEDVAERLGITSQAVSKWECAQSYPDIELLPEISKMFNVTLDQLIMGEEKARNIMFPFPDDTTVRVLVFKGHELIECDFAESEIPLKLSELINASDIEIHGNCAVAGDISCDTINVNGNLASYDIIGDIKCIGKINCESIRGDLTVENGNVTCKDITGDVFAEGNISCRSFSGEVNDRA